MTSANVNPGNSLSVTLTAQWQATCAVAVGTVYNFNYTGGQQTYSIPCTGHYKLEVWGGQGGNGTGTYTGMYGGPGGYSVGVIQSTKNSTIYIYVGGKGSDWSNYLVNGGYNGGGYSRTSGAAGGGATHIATVSGLLQNLSSYKDTGGTNISREILIVSGGGGGWDGGTPSYGGAGGGYIGQSSSSSITGGSQTSPGITPGFENAAFGRGFQTTSTENISGGGGGGWYGGGSSAGGSGYIGSSDLVSGLGVTKHMTCYSCTTSTAVATRTNSNTNVSGTATADYSKTGNGYARITWMGDTL